MNKHFEDEVKDEILDEEEEEERKQTNTKEEYLQSKLFKTNFISQAVQMTLTIAIWINM